VNMGLGSGNSNWMTGVDRTGGWFYYSTLLFYQLLQVYSHDICDMGFPRYHIWCVNGSGVCKVFGADYLDLGTRQPVILFLEINFKYIIYYFILIMVSILF
jgi:hypothetical protein